MMQRRRGFTITELLVSMALILFMMAILSEAFVAGLGTFRDLKAIGDMDQKLRAALVILDRDLAARHFDNGSRNLSDITASSPAPEGFFAINRPNSVSGSSSISTPAVGATSINLAGPPSPVPSIAEIGYSIYLFGGVPEIFVITGISGTTVTLNSPVRQAGHNVALWGTIPEGTDQYTTWPLAPPPPPYPPVPSGPTSGVPHYATHTLLHFTVNLKYPLLNDSGNTKVARRENFLVANLGPPAGNPSVYWTLANSSPFPDMQNYRSQTAEVAYFLRWNGTATTGGTPLFTLYRRQAVIAHDQAASLNALLPALRATTTLYPSSFFDLSCYPDPTASPAYSSVIFNTMAGGGNTDVRNPAHRALTNQAAPSPWQPKAAPSLPYMEPIMGDRLEGFVGADILLTDVLSFSVRAYRSDTNDFVTVDSYDTFTPPAFSIKALEITLRVFDAKTLKTRQITLIQNM